VSFKKNDIVRSRILPALGRGRLSFIYYSRPVNPIWAVVWENQSDNDDFEFAGEADLMLDLNGVQTFLGVL
jgi:hypothetical protein